MAAEQGWVDGHLQMGTLYYRKFMSNIVKIISITQINHEILGQESKVEFL